MVFSKHRKKYTIPENSATIQASEQGRPVCMAKSRSEIQANYDKSNTRYVGLKLNRKTDAEIIKKLESADSMQGYIRELIRKDLSLSMYHHILDLMDIDGYKLTHLEIKEDCRTATMIKADSEDRIDAVIHITERLDGSIVIDQNGRIINEYPPKNLKI